MLDYTFQVRSQIIKPTDWQPWLLALVAAAVRALLGAILAALTGGTAGFKAT